MLPVYCWLLVGFLGYGVLLWRVVLDDGWSATCRRMSSHLFPEVVVLVSFTCGGVLTLLVAVKVIADARRDRF